MRMEAAAIVLRETGGPEVLRLETLPVGDPGRGEIRVRQTAIGVNFHDIYVRSGLYKTLALPGVPGVEAAGVVEAVGAGVAAFREGDRIAYVTKAYGGYASRRLLDANLAMLLPKGVDDRLAAASFVKGLTAAMLLQSVPGPARRGETCLVHAAAGGVGRLLCQWAHHLGVRVIGTVGSDAKAKIAREHGCDETIVYTAEDFVERALALTGGRGVDVVYDSVGGETFEGSLAALARRGRLVNFGQSSGPIAPFVISRLAAKSNALSRPMLFDYIAEPNEYAGMAAALFAGLGDGWLRVGAAAEYKLAAAGEAHRALESRRTSGSTILVP